MNWKLARDKQGRVQVEDWSDYGIMPVSVLDQMYEELRKHGQAKNVRKLDSGIYLSNRDKEGRE